MTDLNEVTDNLGHHYTAWKHEEKMKNKFKDEFFEAATEELKKEVPAQIYEKIVAASESEAKAMAQKKFPTFRVLDVLPEYDGYRVALEENPELRSFSYESTDGFIYQRQVVQGAAMIDDEKLQKEDPDLWEAVTHIPEPKRTLKPLDQLDPELLVQLEKYIYAAKPTVKLAAPKKRKLEELADEEDRTDGTTW